MNKGNKSNALITLIITVVIIAVLGLGVYATYSKLSKNIIDNKIASGEMEETVSHAAEAAGMSVEDYLADYGLTVTDEVNGKTPVNDLYGYMTLENYMNMNNANTSEDPSATPEPVDINAMIEEWGLTGQVTKDSLWKDVENLMPLKARFGEEQLAQYKEAYNLGDEVTGDTSYGDFQKIIEEKIAQMTSATAAPEGEAQTGENSAE